MKIIYDKKKCIGCQSCVSICPEYFDIEDGKIFVSIADVDEKDKKLKEAIDACPFSCIKLK